MGPTVPDILLEGEGIPRPAEWSVEPGSLLFEFVYLGSSEEKSLQIHNSGGTLLELNPVLSDPEIGFTRHPGGGEFPAGTRLFPEVAVTFQPQIEGYFETLLILGPELTPVPVMGWAEVFRKRLSR